jgi:hypothetical protein
MRSMTTPHRWHCYYAVTATFTHLRNAGVEKEADRSGRACRGAGASRTAGRASKASCAAEVLICDAFTK